MKSKEEFESFYEKELRQPIEQLEDKRKSIAEKYSFKRYWRNLKWLGILILVFGIANAVVEQIPSEVGIIVPVTIVYAIGAAIYIGVKRGSAFKPIKQEYRETVIPKIINFVDSNLKYEPEGGITLEEFMAGEIYGRPTSFSSEDLVYGKTGDFEIRMSDIKSSRRSNSSGKSGSDRVTIFDGLYIIAKLNKNIPTGVILKPSFAIAEALGGLARNFLGEKLVNSLVSKFDLKDIEIGDAEFDKMYQIKCVDTDAAKALLTQKFIQIIKSFQKEVNLPVAFSFFDNVVHISFSGPNLFKSSAYTSFTEKDISKQYFTYLNLGYGIIEAVQAR